MSGRDSTWRVVARREFLRWGLGGGAAWALGCAPRSRVRSPGEPAAALTLPDDDPIATLPDGRAEAHFFGDELERFHLLLRNKAHALGGRGGLPTRYEPTRVCIVGGGLAGLSAAWLLKDLRPIVLEGASRFGGNAQGHRWGDLTYGIGSAYITGAEPDALHMQMLQAFGLSARLDHPGEDAVQLAGVIHPGFWTGATDRSHAKDFAAAWEYFREVRERRYPDIPWAAGGQLTRDELATLDRRSFADELARALGPRLHPHVEDLVRHYCWSSFAADPTEISAAAGLNFLASDLGGTQVLPGGNAAIASALVQGLRALGSSLRSSAVTLDVRRTEDGVQVTYAGVDGQVRGITCDACVVATPKFVARKLIDSLPVAQAAAIEELTYRAYVVAHVLIDQPCALDFHDLYCMTGAAPGAPLADVFAQRAFTDVVLASFATHGHPRRTALNLYRALPYDGARAGLMRQDSYRRTQELLAPALPPLLAALGLAAERIVDVRLTRFGHALVVPKPGLITAGLAAAAAAPVAERIFLAQQDNYALPAFEPAFAAAVEAATAARRVLA